MRSWPGIIILEKFQLGEDCRLERIAATEARAGQIVQGKGIDYREKTFNHGDHNEHKEDDAGRRNEQASRR